MAFSLRITKQRRISSKQKRTNSIAKQCSLLPTDSSIPAFTPKCDKILSSVGIDNQWRGECEAAREADFFASWSGTRVMS